MRIIGGKYRGKQLKMPDRTTTRPMADRIKEAIFNKLEHAFLKNGVSRLRSGKVMDSFGGTGALGLEALSRGAQHATIMELSRPAFLLIKENAVFLPDPSVLSLILGDATQPPKTVEPADLIFVAPPYGQGLVKPSLEGLQKQGWISAETLLVIEIGSKESLDIPENFQILDSKSYAATQILYVCRKKTALNSFLLKAITF